MNIVNLKEEIHLQAERIKYYLSKNQLIQANAKAIKIENVIRDIITASNDQNEAHPLWTYLRASTRCQSFILNGETDKALAEAEFIYNSILNS